MNKRSKRNLAGVDRSLQTVVEHAYGLFSDEVTRLPGSRLIITQGLRTKEEQRSYVDAGRSWTMQSKHLIGEAVDFAIISKGVAIWELPVYERVWLACFRPAGHCLDTELTWGGSWKTRDGPHIELS